MAKTEIQELKEELAKLRRDFASRALSEIQERVKVHAALSIKIEEMEGRFLEREKTFLARVKALSGIQKVQAQALFGVSEMKLDEDEGHRI